MQAYTDLSHDIDHRQLDSLSGFLADENDTASCNYLYVNHTGYLLKDVLYEGIPDNLLLNVIVWLVRDF